MNFYPFHIGDYASEKNSAFLPLTATNNKAYDLSVAETKATKIGVLDIQADDRHQCGIFSSTAWPPYGRVVRESRKTRRACIRYANPARSAHPDWRRDERNQKPLYRSSIMSYQYSVDSSKFDEATLRLYCATNMLSVLSAMLSSKADLPNREILSGSIYGVERMLNDAYSMLSGGEVAK